MREKLKPCPFCGGSNVQVIEYKAGYGTVGCGDCCFEFPDMDYMDTTENAITKWNNRANEGLLRKLLQAMCAIRDEKIARRKEDNSPAFVMVLMREDEIYQQAKAFLQQEAK
ncbi:MAG: Lar family restriction alleviation protein [Synergistaceae bacterium]|nr:Lar family restriction alleviation protein [Synergistaceae bacterium]